MALDVRQALFGRESVLRPVDIETVCRAGRFCLHERRLGGVRGGLEAVLAPAPVDRFEIHVDPEPAGGWATVPVGLRGTVQRHRLRFRAAHEIGHSFFYDRSAEVPRRSLGNSRQQEEFCDRFAAELLLPSEVVAAVEPSPRALVELATRYDVSLQMATRSFSAHRPDLLVALLVEGAGQFERQWAAGDRHLPTGWWRKMEAVVRFCNPESIEALPMPARNQVLLFAERS